MPHVIHGNANDRIENERRYQRISNTVNLCRSDLLLLFLDLIGLDGGRDVLPEDDAGVGPASHNHTLVLGYCKRPNLHTSANVNQNSGFWFEKQLKIDKNGVRKWEY